MIDATDTCPGISCCNTNPFAYKTPSTAAFLKMGDVCSTCSGVVFSQTITAFGIGPVLTWAIVAGALPGGLTFHGGQNSNGYVLIDGTPTVTGNFSITVQATNLEGVSIVGTFSINVLNITNSSLPSFTVGKPYSAQLLVSGGVGPFTWFVVSGTLPSGITLNSGTGLLSGTPNGVSSGSGNITFGVIDNGCH